MRRTSPTTRSLVFTCFAALVGGCFEDVPDPIGDGDTSTGDGDGDGDPSPGDGDGDPSTGDGDGDPSTGDGDGDPSTGDGDGDGDPTAGEQCDSGYACVPDPGPAWTGPFALREAADGCGDAFPDVVESLFADLQVEPGSCACSCGTPTVTCSTDMDVIGYAGANCVNGQGFNALSPNQCYNTFSASHGVFLPPPQASCGAGSVAEDLPEPSFATQLVSCGGFAPGPDEACGARALCVPEPEGSLGGLCYASEGDVSCPAGYPDKTLYATGFEDTRACPDSCSCSASGAVCTVSITGYAQDNCISPQGAKSTDSGAEVCAAVSSVVQSIRPGNVTVKNAGTCSPGNAALSGEVSAQGAVTVCCSG